FHQAVEVGGRLEAAGRAEGLHPAGGEVADVALALFQAEYLVPVDVEAEHRKAGGDEDLRERQPNVAQADDADAGRAEADGAGQRKSGRRESCSRVHYGGT